MMQQHQTDLKRSLVSMDGQESIAEGQSAVPMNTNQVKSKPGDCRCLQAWAFSLFLDDVRSRPLMLKFTLALISTLITGMMVLMISANILEYLVVFGLIFCVRWLFLVATISLDTNNLLTFITFLVWVAVPVIAPFMIGTRGYEPMSECIICLFVFAHILSTLQAWAIVFVPSSLKSHDYIMRLIFYFFMNSDFEMATAVIMLCVNTLTVLLLIVIEGTYISPRGLHTWWLLNGNVARSVKLWKPFSPALAVGRRYETQKDSMLRRGGGRSGGGDSSYLLRVRRESTSLKFDGD